MIIIIIVFCCIFGRFGPFVVNANWKCTIVPGSLCRLCTGCERYCRPLLKVVYCPSRRHNFDVILSKDSFLPLLSNISVFLPSIKQDATGGHEGAIVTGFCAGRTNREMRWLQQHLLQHCEGFFHGVLQFSWRRNITKSLISKESTTELHCEELRIICSAKCQVYMKRNKYAKFHYAVIL